LQVDYVTVVEDRRVRKILFPVVVFHFWPKLQRTLQRGLSAIAEHLVLNVKYMVNVNPSHCCEVCMV